MSEPAADALTRLPTDTDDAMSDLQRRCIGYRLGRISGLTERSNQPPRSSLQWTSDRPRGRRGRKRGRSSSKTALKPLPATAG